MTSVWIVCQIGAREHYGIARGLHQAGRLGALVTDFWVPSGSSIGRLPGVKRLTERFHHSMEKAIVYSSNNRMLVFELLARMQKQQCWQQVLARNALFQQQALKKLATLYPSSSDVTLFSYSYAALELFREARQRGWKTVLGQIDPGPGEDAIVRRLRAQHPEWVGTDEASPPDSYWEQWREECALADRIVVNSAWSRSLLIEAGIEAAKIEVVALALEVNAEKLKLEIGGKGHPITQLRVLWLGQVNVRKGIQDLAAAAEMLAEDAGRDGFVEAGTGRKNGGGQDPRATVDRASCPELSSAISRAHQTLLGRAAVRIDVVGPHGALPTGLPCNLLFHGPVVRSEAGAWYYQADVFVLPTHSDGFALTQLEAMAHGLPVIATPRCGEVVEEGMNGWIIPAGDPQALAARLRWIADNPGALEPMRHAAKLTAAKFGLDRLVEALLER